MDNYAIHGGKSSIRCRGAERLNALRTGGETPVQNSQSKGWKILVRHPEQSERILGAPAAMQSIDGNKRTR